MEYKGKFRVYASGTSTTACGLWSDGNGWCAVHFHDDGQKHSGLYCSSRKEAIELCDSVNAARGQTLVGELFKPWALRLVGHE